MEQWVTALWFCSAQWKIKFALTHIGRNMTNAITSKQTQWAEAWIKLKVVCLCNEGKHKIICSKWKKNKKKGDSCLHNLSSLQRKVNHVFLILRVYNNNHNSIIQIIVNCVYQSRGVFESVESTLGLQHLSTQVQIKSSRFSPFWTKCIFVF